MNEEFVSDAEFSEGIDLVNKIVEIIKEGDYPLHTVSFALCEVLTGVCANAGFPLESMMPLIEGQYNDHVEVRRNQAH